MPRTLQKQKTLNKNQTQNMTKYFIYLFCHFQIDNSNFLWLLFSQKTLLFIHWRFKYIFADSKAFYALLNVIAVLPNCSSDQKASKVKTSDVMSRNNRNHLMGLWCTDNYKEPGMWPATKEPDVLPDKENGTCQK